MFMGMGMPIPDLSNLPGVSRPGRPGDSGVTVDLINNVYSFKFDGAASYFDAGNPTELQFTGAFSVSFWMKGNLASAGNRAMVSKDSNTSNPRAFSIERTNAFPGGYFVIYNGTSAYGVYVASSDANYINIGDNNWHNVIGVYTPSTSVELFVDGNFIKSNTTNIPASVNFVNNNLNIGRRSQGVNYFPGNIDEVAVFGRALVEEEAKLIYDSTNNNSGKTADLNTLSTGAPTAWYRMGD